MKKLPLYLSTVVLASGIAFAQGGTSYAAESEKEPSIPLKAETVYDLDETGQKLSESSNFFKTDFELISKQIKKDSILLEGNVTNKNGTKAFKIKGSLKESNDTNKRAVATNVEDLEGNFKVITVQVDGDPQNSSYYFNEKSKSSAKNLKVYLLDVESNDFTVLETKNQAVFQGSAYEGAIDDTTLTKIKAKDELWYSDLLKPKNGIQKKEEEGPTALANPYPDADTDLYFVSYDVGGETVTETIDVTASLDGPVTLTGSEATTASLSITDEGTTSQYDNFNSSDSNFRVGQYGTNEIRFRTGDGIGIRSAEWDTSGFSDGGITSVLEWKYSESYGPVSWTASYTGDQEVGADVLKTFNNYSVDNMNKLVRVDFSGGDDDVVLNDVGHGWYTKFDIKNYNASGTEEIQQQTVYNLYNNQEYYYDSKTDTRTYYFGTD